MSKFLFLCQFMGRSSSRQTGLWSGTALFYITSFYIFGFLLFPLHEKKIFWTFYLFIQNFSIALLLKNSFQEDFSTTRLHSLKHQPFPLEFFIIAKMITLTVMMGVLQLILLPFLIVLFKPFFYLEWILFLTWQILSIGFLVAFYLLGAAFSLKSYFGDFLNMVIVTPLLVPWFILSFEYLVLGELTGILGIFTLALVFIPLIIAIIRLLLRSVTVYLV